MSQAIPQGPFCCLASTLQFPPQPINKKKKTDIKREARGAHHSEQRPLTLFKMRGRLHCFPADDGSHNWSVPASERAALTSAGVNINTTRRHHVSLKAGKGEKRKHLWPSDVSCKQTDQAVGRHALPKKKKDKGERNQPRAVVWVWSQQLTLTGGARGVSHSSAGRKGRRVLRGGGRRGASGAIPVV